MGWVHGQVAEQPYLTQWHSAYHAYYEPAPRLGHGPASGGDAPENQVEGPRARAPAHRPPQLRDALQVSGSHWPNTYARVPPQVG
jgi:hypothetical protein